MSQEMVIIIRPSFLKMCDGDACTAATLNHVLYWIARKARQGADSWYGTGEEVWESMSRAWGVNTIRAALRTLTQKLNFLGQFHKGYQQTRHYTFGKEQAIALYEACEKAGVCLWHLDLPDDVRKLILPHLTTLVNGVNESGKSICQLCEMELPDLGNGVNGSGNSIQRVTPKSTTKETTKRVCSDRAREILSLISQTLGVTFTPTSSHLSLAQKIEDEHHPTNEDITAVVERMKNSPYWKKKGGVPIQAISKLFGEELGMVQQEQAAPFSGSSSHASGSSTSYIEQNAARNAMGPETASGTSTQDEPQFDENTDTDLVKYKALLKEHVNGLQEDPTPFFMRDPQRYMELERASMPPCPPRNSKHLSHILTHQQAS